MDNQRHHVGPDGYLSLTDSYPSLPEMNVFDFWINWSDFLDRWGKLCSIGMGILFTAKFLTWLFGLVLRCLHHPRVDGWGHHLIGLFMPSFRSMRSALKKRKKVEQIEEKEMLHQAMEEDPKDLDYHQLQVRLSLLQAESDRQMAADYGITSAPKE